MKTIKRIYLPMVLILLIVILSSCSFTTANISNLSMSTGVDANYAPINTTVNFTTTTPMIYVSGTVNNAPSDTTIGAKWYYLDTDSEIYIDGSNYLVEDTTSNFYFSLSIPDMGWPTGTYRVDMLIDGKVSDSIVFLVE